MKKLILVVCFLFVGVMFTSCDDPNNDVLEETLNTTGEDGQPPVDNNPPPGVAPSGGN